MNHAAITTTAGATTNSSNGPSTHTKSTSTPPTGAVELQVSVVAVNDLPVRDQPSYLTLKVHKNGKSLSTGPPTSRHKDRNSFKFGPLAQNLVVSSKTLSALYVGHLYVEVVYDTNATQNLMGSIAVKDLCSINESSPKTILLELSPKDGGAILPVGDLLDETPAPVLKLKVQLKAPYRPEIETLRAVLATWFGWMDQVEHSCTTLANKTMGINKLYFVVPAVPIATGAILMAPILAGMCVVFFPVLIPMVVALLTVVVCGLGTGLVLWGSTPTGRQFIQQKISLKQLQSTETGQAFLYPTGPRPNPVHLARLVLPSSEDMWGRLAVSLVIDAVGSASYLLPLVGEVTDIAWAPLQTIFIMALYDTTTPHLKYLSFTEEILPFTDFVPSATIGWAAQFGPKLLKNNTSVSTDPFKGTDLVFQESGASGIQT